MKKSTIRILPDPEKLWPQTLDQVPQSYTCLRREAAGVKVGLLSRGHVPVPPESTRHFGFGLAINYFILFWPRGVPLTEIPPRVWFG